MTPWIQCYDCGKVVKINKPLLGSLHLCIPPEQRQARRMAQAAMQAQLNYKQRPRQGGQE